MINVLKNVFRTTGGVPLKLNRRLSTAPKRINLWTQPRSSSTSLMYSFKSRGDCSVVDEPLYAHYVEKRNVYRPYRDQLLEAQSPNVDRVLSDVILCENKYTTDLAFFKHMGKQLLAEMDWEWILQCHNVILLRHPRDVLASFHAGLGDVESAVAESGLLSLWEIFKYVKGAKNESLNDKHVCVILHDDLIRNPEGTLRALCKNLDIDFVPSMLKWEKGGIPEDGIWAKTWYHSSHASDSFIKKDVKPSLKALPESVESAIELELSRPFEELKQQRLKPEPILPDERNADIKIHVGGKLLHRDKAKISVFDSVVQGGDAVWEGLRVYNGRIFELDEHLQRMVESAHMLMFEGIPTQDEIKRAIFECLHENKMYNDTHIRLTLTRGQKVSSGMSPTNNQEGCCLIVLPEWKGLVSSSNKSVSAPMTLITSTQRRNNPMFLDSKIHHNNLLNNILAKIEANLANADDALMLDMDGFVSETNATNVFMIKDHVLYTPFADACLPGITRKRIIDISRKSGIKCQEKRLSLFDFYNADEVFCTGTMCGLAPVACIDGRIINPSNPKYPGVLTSKLQKEYLKVIHDKRYSVKIE